MKDYQFILNIEKIVCSVYLDYGLYNNIVHLKCKSGSRRRDVLYNRFYFDTLKL